MNDKLEPAEQKELNECEQIIKRCFLEGGVALCTIRDKKLYRCSYKTFESYLEQKWGMSRAAGYRLIDNAKVVKSLPAPQRKQITSSASASAIAKVPEPQRKSVIKTIVDAGEKVTAKAIQKLAPPPKPKFKSVNDSTGIEVPKEIYGLWMRGRDGELPDKLHELKEIIKWLEQSKQSDDILFVEVGKSMDNLIAKLNQARQEIELAIPYAVCPSCNGVLLVKDCTTCKGRGFVSKFFYHTHVPQEVRDLREKK